MNLFTRYLSRNNRDRRLHELVDHWDQLEALVISVYKSERATDEERVAYGTLRPWLLTKLPDWSAQLDPLWRATLVGGERAPEDPFLRILRAESADGLVGDWVAMQNLAAAREALNRLVMQQSAA